MAQRASHDRGGRLPPAAGAATAAAAASAAMACAVVVLWAILPDAPGSLAFVALPLLLMPLVVAAATWFAAHRAIRASMDLAIESVERLAAPDLSTPGPLAATAETAGLAVAIERCRLSLHEQQRAAKVHAAVARVMGLAIGRLAGRDFDARISVELPPPYQSFRNDFNAAMEAIRSPAQEAAARLREHAREMAQAADQLGRRAGKLHGRIETDLLAVEAGAGNAEEALRAACHTLGGARVAARRNMEAAERFTALSLLIAQEAERLAEGRTAEEEEGAHAPAPGMPTAEFPATLRLASTR